MARLYAALEAVTFLLVCASNGNAEHLTWWNAFLLAVTDAAYVFDNDGPFFRRLWATLIVLSTVVQVTVVAMSLMGCSMIRDTLGEIGPWMYYFGNFASITGQPCEQQLCGLTASAIPRPGCVTMRQD